MQESNESEGKNEFRLTKDELVAKFEIFQNRLDKNPLVSTWFKKYYRIQLELMKKFVKHKDLEYAWPLCCDLWDDLRAFNDRKNDPKLAKINPMFEKQFEAKLAQAPTPAATKKRLNYDWLSSLKQGGMSEK